MIVIKIDVKKISKDALYRGEKGTYLDCALMDRPDEYGWLGYVSQSVSKEKREAGERGPIIGNWKTIETKRKTAPPKPAPAPAADDSDIPW
jgi:hypothetical protein